MDKFEQTIEERLLENAHSIVSAAQRRAHRLLERIIIERHKEELQELVEQFNEAHFNR